MLVLEGGYGKFPVSKRTFGNASKVTTTSPPVASKAQAQSKDPQSADETKKFTQANSNSMSFTDTLASAIERDTPPASPNSPGTLERIEQIPLIMDELAENCSYAIKGLTGAVKQGGSISSTSRKYSMIQTQKKHFERMASKDVSAIVDPNDRSKSSGSTDANNSSDSSSNGTKNHGNTANAANKSKVGGRSMRSGGEAKKATSKFSDFVVFQDDDEVTLMKRGKRAKKEELGGENGSPNTGGKKRKRGETSPKMSDITDEEVRTAVPLRRIEQAKQIYFIT